MDFYQISESVDNRKKTENTTISVYPEFIVKRSEDLMVRGKSFYAIWDEKRGLWSTDEYDVARLIDEELFQYVEEQKKERSDNFHIKTMSNFSSKCWSDFKLFIKSVEDTHIQLDEKLTFSNTIVSKKDYVSKRLPYPLEEGSYAAWNEIIGTLYSEEERAKLEWSIGAVVSGDARNIQKFLVLYGEAGSGKSTILNILQKLFSGYYTTFEAKALTSNSNAFSTEVFRTNPLLGIQHDGDLSRIEDNSKLNSIVSHEEITMNEKYKASYMAKTNCFLFMATNKPVKITDAKSGIIRRLIDVKPSGNKISPERYFQLISQIDFELGAIAYHCLKVYRSMGKNYYANYRPFEMMFQTDVFFNFVEENYQLFKEQDGTTVTQAYMMYKTYCDEGSIEFRLPQYKFREELKNYFKEFKNIARVGPDQKQARSCYFGFLTDKFASVGPIENKGIVVYTMDETVSLFDKLYSKYPAQYATQDETPFSKWDNVKTILSDIDTSKIHYVRPPENHIVIDFDLRDETGQKSLEKNLKEVIKWPPTYSELSKSGNGIHLHYIFDGDVSRLANEYSEGIEIKTFSGKSSLRRKLTKCNNTPIATISSGLPIKGEKLINFDAVKSERGIRDLIQRNLKKEIHPGTKPSIDFIYKILDDAYKNGLPYDITDLRPKILAFANNSTNQSQYCVNLVGKMKWQSEENKVFNQQNYCSDDLIFYDCEVFPNLFVIVWKKTNGKKVPMINPTAEEVGALFQMKLVGFNCRRYDNHILYARYIGYTLDELYQLSRRIITGSQNSMFREAYNISYTDIYDFSVRKQSLKKFEIEMGILHKECNIPWDEPVPEDKIQEVVDYCDADVDATEATFYYREQDWIARQILADLSGLTVNDTTQNHTAKIIFGDDPRPQDKFIYTDLSNEFPGYKFNAGKSTYRGIDPGEGGRVYAEPGMYGNVALLDIESMHPTSLIELNHFGPYTKNYKRILDVRLAIKHGDFERAKSIIIELAKYLVDQKQAKDLGYALKTILNIVYGMSSATFDNKFKDPRNIDNIVAKRGALFMIDLEYAMKEKGFTVAHIKTDSIKIPDATPESIQFVKDFGKKYGYTFEHEATYDKLCLVNDAVYVAIEKTDTGLGKWTATGAQFIHPYVFKTLFSKEDIVFKDLCEVKQVKTRMYLNMNEKNDNQDNHIFIGKVGAFCPMQPGAGGGVLQRKNEKGDFHAVTGTKGYRWLEAETVAKLKLEDKIDLSYFNKLTDAAISAINKYGDFEWFTSDDLYTPINNGILPF